MKRSRGKLATFSKGLGAFGANARALGGTLSTYVTAPIVGLGVMAGKSAMDFESSFAGVRKTVDATDKEFAVMEKQLRALAKQIPVNVNDLNKYGEAAGQLGIRKKNIVEFVKVMADLGATTNLTGEEGAQSLARFANITKMSQKDFRRLGSTIVDLGNNSATTEAEIMEMGLRLAGAGKVVGLTESQILGFSAALSSVGIEAQAGGTAFAKTFIELAKAGGEKLEKFGKVAGMTGKEFRQAFEKDAAGATITFVEGLGKINDSGGDLFGTLEDLGITEVRMRDALLRAAGAGDLMRDSVELGTEAWKKNNALTEEAKKRYETFESKLQLFKNRINDVAISVGNQLLPHFSRLAGTVADLAERFGRLDPAMQATIIKIAGIAAVIGPALIILGTLASSISSIITLAGFLVGGIQAVGSALTLLAANPVGLIIMALGVLAEVVSRLTTGKGLLQNATELLSGATDEEARASNRAKDALNRYQDAVRASKDADLSLQQAKLNLERAQKAQADAQADLTAKQQSGTTSADDLKEAELRVRQANIDVSRSANDLGDAEHNAAAKMSGAAGKGHDLRIANEELRKKQDETTDSAHRTTSELAHLATGFGDTGSAATRGGKAISADWVGGITGSLWASIGPGGSIVRALAAVKKYFGGSLPEAGPLAGMTAARGGQSIGKSWVAGLSQPIKEGKTSLENSLIALPLFKGTPVAKTTNSSSTRTQNITINNYSQPLDARELDNYMRRAALLYG